MTEDGGRDETAVPKYALVERERRWLVDLARCPIDPAVPHMLITDRYLDGFSVDRFIDPPMLPTIAEIECATADALAAITAPLWAEAEISHDPAYEGGALARGRP